MTATLSKPAILSPSPPLPMEGEKLDGYVLFRHIPIFDEHTGDDDVVYDRALLEAIAANCNSRISETDDWCPIVIGHTDDEGEYDPPIVGLAGPFSVEDFKGRACIYADFWILPHCVEQFRKYPRRSVEIWPEERPEDRYFDPIALLGAETPKRDLGVFYAKASEATRRPYRYSLAASAPGGTNTFIPGSEKHRHQKELSMSPEELEQIVQALKPTIATLVAEAMPVPPSDDSMVDEPPPVDDLDADLPQVEEESLPEFDDEQMDYARGLGRKFSRYMRDGDFDEEGAHKYLDTLDDDEKPMLQRYMEDLEEEDEVKQQYAKMCDSGNMASEGFKETAAKYQKQRDESRQRYAKLHREHETLKTRYQKAVNDLKAARQAEKYAKRRGAVIDLRDEGVVGLDDPDEIVQETSDLNDAQFERHLETMSRGLRVPGAIPFGQEQAKRVEREPVTAKYAKAARDIVIRERKRGNNVKYDKVLHELCDTNGKFNGEVVQANGSA